MSNVVSNSCNSNSDVVTYDSSTTLTPSFTSDALIMRDFAKSLFCYYFEVMLSPNSTSETLNNEVRFACLNAIGILKSMPNNDAVLLIRLENILNNSCNSDYKIQSALIELVRYIRTYQQQYNTPIVDDVILSKISSIPETYTSITTDHPLWKALVKQKIDPNPKDKKISLFSQNDFVLKADSSDGLSQYEKAVFDCIVRGYRSGYVNETKDTIILTQRQLFQWLTGVKEKPSKKQGEEISSALNSLFENKIHFYLKPSTAEILDMLCDEHQLVTLDSTPLEYFEYEHNEHILSSVTTIRPVLHGNEAETYVINLGPLTRELVDKMYWETSYPESLLRIQYWDAKSNKMKDMKYSKRRKVIVSSIFDAVFSCRRRYYGSTPHPEKIPYSKIFDLCAADNVAVNKAHKDRTVSDIHRIFDHLKRHKYISNWYSYNTEKIQNAGIAFVVTTEDADTSKTSI